MKVGTGETRDALDAKHGCLAKGSFVHKGDSLGEWAGEGEEEERTYRYMTGRGGDE